MDHTAHDSNNSKGLTSKELKAKLIQVVKNKGIYDSMKVCSFKHLSKKLVFTTN